MLDLTLIFIVVLIGSCMQRISGMGLGLVAGPVLVVIMGPVEGILVVNVLAFINAAATTMTVREYVDWRKFSIISSVLILGAIPAALLVREVSGALLQALVGGLLLLALAVTTFGKKYIPTVSGTTPAVAAGIAGGFMNTLAGIAGPAITVYAQASRWPQQTFAATLQPIFMVAGAISFLTKILSGAGDLSGTNWLIWPVGMLGMAVGLWLGVKLSKKVPREKARKLSLLLASAGGATALVRGLAGMS
ncbi:sulfite exporter TauE/SafE family protein [Corynebacterium alimapuense]|uniref:Probable membrane transporter protein n=1 Tax=Corynebacterium alimapuense TaxID=1576874 RepID=A0A3M8K6B4_9CORY|nr:sulfite exporter TauE/SafE family protein [Corynebacterium alimapuense]RNE48660.1 permease [Corynebacterium alimapuense]